MAERIFGWAPSKLDGTEHIATYPNEELPSSFSYKNVIPGVLDQGATSTCVPHSITSIFDWYTSAMEGRPASFNMSIYNVYDRRDNDGEGMSFKCALHNLLKIGAVTTPEYRKRDFSNALKIQEYAMITNIQSLKYSILLNGPCLIATMVRSMDSPEYWKGYSNYGGHAVSCIGWTDDSLIIRNSWGPSWGDRGYTYMRFDDFSKYVLESWTAII